MTSICFIIFLYFYYVFIFLFFCFFGGAGLGLGTAVDQTAVGSKTRLRVKQQVLNFHGISYLAMLGLCMLMIADVCLCCGDCPRPSALFSYRIKTCIYSTCIYLQLPA